jgi:hypothetical protein
MQEERCRATPLLVNALSNTPKLCETRINANWHCPVEAEPDSVDHAAHRRTLSNLATYQCGEMSQAGWFVSLVTPVPFGSIE